MGEVVAQLSQLSMSYPPDVKALVAVDLQVELGESVAIVGPSGSGKSTLLNVLGLLETPTSGDYQLLGQPVRAMSERRRTIVRGRRLGLIFQAFHLIPYLSVLENVMLPLRNGNAMKMERRAIELLGELGMSHRLNARPPTLSGGERQRTAIARALVIDPALLLCDEPTGSLDSVTGARVIDLLQTVGRAPDRALVIVTHDMDLATRMDRVLTLRDGHLA